MKLDPEKLADAIIESAKDKMLQEIQTDVLAILLMRNGGVLHFTKQELANSPEGTITYDGTSTEDGFIISFLPDDIPGEAH